MANVNKVILIGNLTRDIELKYTPKGTAVAEVGLAVNRNYTVEGDKREETTFVDVELWGRMAELAGQYLAKGRQVYFEGRLKQDTWEDKTSGAKRSKLKMVAENMQFIGGRGEGGGESRGGGGGGGRSYDEEDGMGGGSPPPRSSRPAPSRPEPEEEDDIPF
ncbi:MAG: single-stranded DNA-binding protein [Chthoniobacterales bacterium]